MSIETNRKQNSMKLCPDCHVIQPVTAYNKSQRVCNECEPIRKEKAQNRIHDLQRSAYYPVHKLLRQGLVTKPAECSNCSTPTRPRNLHAHHPDHCKPLQIIWLCTACHLTGRADRKLVNCQGIMQLQGAVNDLTTIRGRRREYHVSQTELGDRLGLARSTMMDIEAGRIRVSIRMFTRIMSAITDISKAKQNEKG